MMHTKQLKQNAIKAKEKRNTEQQQKNKFQRTKVNSFPLLSRFHESGKNKLRKFEGFYSFALNSYSNASEFFFYIFSLSKFGFLIHFRFMCGPTERVLCMYFSIFFFLFRLSNQVFVAQLLFFSFIILRILACVCVYQQLMSVSFASIFFFVFFFCCYYSSEHQHL